jgi:hypothetical protein
VSKLSDDRRYRAVGVRNDVCMYAQKVHTSFQRRRALRSLPHG